MVLHINSGFDTRKEYRKNISISVFVSVLPIYLQSLTFLPVVEMFKISVVRWRHCMPIYKLEFILHLSNILILLYHVIYLYSFTFKMLKNDLLFYKVSITSLFL